MFLLMGAFAFNSGMTVSVYKVFRMWFWWLPGGLAVATNWASAAFGAISGSSLAVTAVMARIAIPEMLKAATTSRWRPAWWRLPAPSTR